MFEKSRKKRRKLVAVISWRVVIRPDSSRINSKGKTINSQRLSVCRSLARLHFFDFIEFAFKTVYTTLLN